MNSSRLSFFGFYLIVFMFAGFGEGFDFFVEDNVADVVF